VYVNVYVSTTFIYDATHFLVLLTILPRSCMHSHMHSHSHTRRYNDALTCAHSLAHTKAHSHARTSTLPHTNCVLLRA
jgi:hypothetical protein